jgi:hypothetical protein
MNTNLSKPAYISWRLTATWRLMAHAGVCARGEHMLGGGAIVSTFVLTD